MTCSLCTKENTVDKNSKVYDLVQETGDAIITSSNNVDDMVRHIVSLVVYVALCLDGDNSEELINNVVLDLDKINLYIAEK